MRYFNQTVNWAKFFGLANRNHQVYFWKDDKLQTVLEISQKKVELSKNWERENWEKLGKNKNSQVSWENSQKILEDNWRENLIIIYEYPWQLGLKMWYIPRIWLPNQMTKNENWENYLGESLQKISQTAKTKNITFIKFELDFENINEFRENGEKGNFFKLEQTQKEKIKSEKGVISIAKIENIEPVKKIENSENNLRNKKLVLEKVENSQNELQNLNQLNCQNQKLEIQNNTESIFQIQTKNSQKTASILQEGKTKAWQKESETEKSKTEKNWQKNDKKLVEKKLNSQKEDQKNLKILVNSETEKSKLEIKIETIIQKSSKFLIQKSAKKLQYLETLVLDLGELKLQVLETSKNLENKTLAKIKEEIYQKEKKVIEESKNENENEKSEQNWIHNPQNENQSENCKILEKKQEISKNLSNQNEIRKEGKSFDTKPQKLDLEKVENWQKNTYGNKSQLEINLKKNWQEFENENQKSLEKSENKNKIEYLAKLNKKVSENNAKKIKIQHFSSNLQAENHKNIENFELVSKEKTVSKNIRNNNPQKNQTLTTELTCKIIDFWEQNDKIWTRIMDKRTRYGTRKAVDFGWQVSFEKNSENFEIFYNLCQETSFRQGFAIHSKNYLQRLFDEPFSRIIILFDQNIAQAAWLGIWQSENQNSILTNLYGGNSLVSRDNYGQYFLHLAAIFLAKWESSDCNSLKNTSFELINSEKIVENSQNNLEIQSFAKKHYDKKSSLELATDLQINSENKNSKKIKNNNETLENKKIDETNQRNELNWSKNPEKSEKVEEIQNTSKMETELKILLKNSEYGKKEDCLIESLKLEENSEQIWQEKEIRDQIVEKKLAEKLQNYHLSQCFYDLGGLENGKGFDLFKKGYFGQKRSFVGPFDIILEPKKYQTVNQIIKIGKVLKSLKKLETWKFW